MSVVGSLTIASTHALDRAIAVSSADRVAWSIAWPPDGVCEIPLRMGRVAAKGTEIVCPELDAFVVGGFAHLLTPYPDGWLSPICREMIRIAVSPAAYEAIVATLSTDTAPFAPQRTPQGEYLLILDQRTMARLTELRGQGESYSDVILRMAAD